MVVTQSHEQISRDVTALMEKGWVPHGDTKFVYGSSGFSYAQAMVKIEPVNVNVPGAGGNILVPQ